MMEVSRHVQCIHSHPLTYNSHSEVITVITVRSTTLSDSTCVDTSKVGVEKSPHSQQ